MKNRKLRSSLLLGALGLLIAAGGALAPSAHAQSSADIPPTAPVIPPEPPQISDESTLVTEPAPAPVVSTPEPKVAEPIPVVEEEAPAAAEVVSEPSAPSGETPVETPQVAARPEAAPAAQTVARRDHRIPTYQQHVPQIGVTAAFAPRALGGKSVARGQDGAAKQFSVQVDWQPKAVQKYGAIDLGASLGIFPIDGGATAHAYSVYEFGAQARYQFRYFREQPIVPVLAFNLEVMNYWFQSSGASGRAIATGPSLGAWILLNGMEPRAAGDFYTEYGVSRSYLVIEARSLSASNELIAFSGPSLFFGLRLEM